MTAAHAAVATAILMNMPVLSKFLSVKGRQLRGLAVNEIGRAMAAAALAQGMDAMADRSAAEGVAELSAARAEAKATRQLAAKR